MAVVSLNIAGRFYRFSCNDGQEAHMKHLATLLNEKAKQLMTSMGEMQETQLLVLMCLLLEEDIYNTNKQMLSKDQASDITQEDTIKDIKPISEKIDTLINKVKFLKDSISE